MPISPPIFERVLVFTVLGALIISARAQTTATMIDFGATAPTPGPSDISQTSTAGDLTKPDGLNYYTDNQAAYNDGEPGQTFTTGSNAGHYVLTSLFIKSAGLDSGNGTPGTAISYLLHIYSISGSSASLVASYKSATAVGYREGDWVRWTGLSVPMTANSTYAYSFGKGTPADGWDALAVAGGNLYAGGDIGLFPTSGGKITLGSSKKYDAAFDLVLAPQTGPLTATPGVSPTNDPVYAGTFVTLTEAAPPQAIDLYQWQTDGGAGGYLTNIPGANASNLVINTSGLDAGSYNYDVVLSNSTGTSTSTAIVLNIFAGSIPILTADVTPKSATDSVGASETFVASFTGTLPIFYQWQSDTGLGMTNIVGATNDSLTLANLQSFQTGDYRLLASNSIGGPVASGVASMEVGNVPSYADAVLAAKPVGYWRLNETGDTSSGSLVAVDAVDYANGTYGNESVAGAPGPGPAFGFPGFEGDNTGAEFANGSAQSYVTLPALNLNANTVTITAWIYPVGTPADYAGIFLCRNLQDAAGLAFGLDGQIGYNWNQNSESAWGWSSRVAPPLNRWSFVALVISPASAAVYLCNTNGEISATNVIAHSAEPFTSFTLIGGDNADDDSGARTFNGMVDEVAVFNYSLTQTEVLNLYFNAAGGAPRVGAIEVSPSNTVFAGTSLTLTSSAAGLAPFSYQWQTNGVNVPGATSPTLVVTNATLQDGGQYDVLVSDIFGTNQSAAVALTVNPPAYSFFAPELVNGSFQVEYSAPPGGTYIFETSTDLVNWMPLTTNIPVASTFVFIDTNALGNSGRFYRAVGEP